MPTPQPTLQQQHLAPSLDAMARELLSWDLYAMLDAKPFYNLERVPLRFNSLDEYLDLFEPLLLDECRAQIVRSTFESDAPHHHMPLIAANKTAPFRVFTFKLPDATVDTNLKCGYVETDLVLVSHERFDLAAALEGAEQQFYTLALVCGLADGNLKLKCFLPERKPPLMLRTNFERLTTMSKGLHLKSGKWFIFKLGNMITINREFQALYSVRDLPLAPQLLRPGPLADKMTPPLLKPPAALMRVIEKMHDRWQLSAIKMSLSARGITLIQGPPGTGKTRTIIGILSALLAADSKHGARGAAAQAAAAVDWLDEWRASARERAQLNVASCLAAAAPWLRSPPEARFAATPPPVAKEGEVPSIFPRVDEDGGHFFHLDRSTRETAPRRVLVCAPSNAAIDEIVSRLLNRHAAGDSCMRDARGEPCVASVVRVGPNVKESLMHVSLESLARKRQAEKESLSYDAARMLVLNETSIVCTTLSCAGYAMFSQLKSGFDTVLIDEAAQSVEMSSLIPLKYGCRRLILVGDPKQLPATVFSDAAVEHNYEQSMFQRLQRGGQQVALLARQYRMHPAISCFPSLRFYKGTLEDDPGLAKRPSRPWHEKRCFSPYVFYDVVDGRAEEVQSSWKNELEAQLMLNIIRQLISVYGVAPESIGIIAPYNAQVRHVRRLLADALGAELAARLEVNSVDGFQGREKEIVLLSTVRSDFKRAKWETRGVGFVKDERRINVSLTRAKHSLFVLGNAATLKGAPVWKELIADASERDCLLRATSPLNIWFETASKETAPMRVAAASGEAEKCDELSAGADGVEASDTKRRRVRRAS